MSIKKTVSFNSICKVRVVLHIDDYTPREVRACFHSKEENKAIKDSARYAIQLMEKCGEASSSSESCTRGLESFTAEAGERRRQLRYASIDAVLDARDFSLKHNVPLDHDAVAQDYARFSRIASDSARRAGIKDEQDAHQEQSTSRSSSFNAVALVAPKTPKTAATTVLENATQRSLLGSPQLDSFRTFSGRAA